MRIEKYLNWFKVKNFVRKQIPDLKTHKQIHENSKLIGLKYTTTLNFDKNSRSLYRKIII